jgi:monooxygenase
MISRQGAPLNGHPDAAPAPENTLREHVDVLIVGAGLSGIAAACVLRQRCPHKRVLILEARADLGGTWDLFRYPGTRSDSDMLTLGYSFRPWREARSLADGASIQRYIRDSAQDFGVDRVIRYRHRVTRANWSSLRQRWMLDVAMERDGELHAVQFSCDFLMACTGYFQYAEAHAPVFPGVEDFRGPVVHPQFWPESLRYAGKRIVVIGSGATAVTLVPALSEHAAHVTMLQRSPSYILCVPNAGPGSWMRRLPAAVAYRFSRWRSVAVGLAFYQLCRRFPALVRRYLINSVQTALGPHYDVRTHFVPRYDPWDQRMCLAPDGDFFTAIRAGRASVWTGEIERFTADGVRLSDGRTLDADLIILATGLKLSLMGGVRIEVDGSPVDVATTLSYRGAMHSGIPNFASTFGYTTASWTLKCELTCRFVCRLLNYMDRRGFSTCTPTVDAGSVQAQNWVNLTSGYLQRSQDLLPRQGSRRPWKMYQNYLLDLLLFYFGRLDDNALKFRGPAAATR